MAEGKIDLSVVLTSAAVSAVVSGLFTLVAQLLERRVRLREFPMKMATDWAVKHLEQALQIGHQRGVVQVPALGWPAYHYHR